MFQAISRITNHKALQQIPKNEDALRIGILGAAGIAPYALIYPASHLKEAVVTTVAARDINRAKQFAAKFKIPKVLGSYDELLADPDIDAVFIPLPNSLHCEWAIKALKAGKHVLCEKPIASNHYEAEQMTTAAVESGKVLMEAFHYRYHPLTARLQEILASGELGTIKEVVTLGYIPFFSFSKDDIRFRFDLAGGATMDFGCYAINLIRLILGEEPTEVTSAAATLYKPQIDESMQATLTFPSGAVARLDYSLRAWTFRSRITVRGDKGELELSGFPLFSMVHSLTVKDLASGKSRTEKIYGEEQESTYFHQLKAFVKTVRGDAEACKSTKEDAILNMKVIDSIYEKAGLQVRGKTPENV